MALDTKLISSKALAIGDCTSCSKPIRQGSCIFADEVSSSSVYQRIHPACLFQKLEEFTISYSSEDDSGQNPELRCSELGPKITHINHEPVEIQIVRRGVALCEATKAAEVERLLEGVGVLTLHFNEAFHRAVMNGDLPIVKEFLRTNPQIEPADLYEKVCFAASKGKEIRKDNDHREQTKERSLNDPRLSQIYTENHPDGYLGIIQELLKNREITLEQRGQLVFQAAVHGHDEITAELLKEPIPIQKRGMALCIATEQMNPTIVGQLLNTDEAISSRHLEYAFKEAMENGDLESAILVQKKLPVSVSQEKPIQSASASLSAEDYLQDFNALLERNDEDEISKLQTHREALFAASRTSSEALDTILGNASKPTFLKWRGEALCIAASKQESLPNIPKLLETRIPKKQRGEALCILLKEGLGTLEIVNLFLQKPIPRKDRILAIELAVQKEQWKILEILLKDQGQIPQATRDDVFVKSAREAFRDNPDARNAVRAVLENGRVSTEAQNQLRLLKGKVGNVFFDILKLGAVEESTRTRPSTQALANVDEMLQPTRAMSASSSSSGSIGGSAGTRPSTSSSSNGSNLVNNVIQTSLNSSRRDNNNQNASTGVFTGISSVNDFILRDDDSTSVSSAALNDDDTLIDEPKEKKGESSSFFSMATVITIAKIVLPLLAIVGAALAIYAYFTLGLMNPFTIAFAAGAVVLTITTIALYILTRTGNKVEKPINTDSKAK